MRQDDEWARQRFAAAPVARLATVSSAGRPRIVPIVFAGIDDATLVTAVDGKPKSTRQLARLADLATRSEVSLLVDHYDEDWNELWWARADGSAMIAGPGSPDEAAAVRALAERYRQYREVSLDGPVILITVTRWSGWSA